MKKLLPLLFALLFIPFVSHAAIAVPWLATSTDPGYIQPNPINGNNPFLKILSIATSTFSNGINLPAGGCFAIGGVCITGSGGGSGTVTQVNTTYPVTGGPITTTGTIALAFGTTTANTWSQLQTFTSGLISQASSTISALHLGTPLEVASGGTASSTLSGILKGNGTGQVQTAVAGTDYVVPASPFTTGSIPFANSSGQLTQDNSSLFYDAVDKRVGIGTNLPSQSLSIAAPNSNNWAQLDRTNTSFESAFQWTTGGAPNFFLGLRNVSPATGLHMYDYTLGRDVMVLNAAGDIEWNQGGNFVIDNLNGTGSRMVVASALGALSTQAIPTGTVTSVSGTYPVQSTGGATPVVSLAFGTTTSNTWAGTQTFTNPITIGTLTGPLQAVSGVVSASSSLSVGYGGTGSTTSLGGILAGNGFNGIKSAIIGTGLAYDGTTLSATGGTGSGLATSAPIASSNLLAYSSVGAGSAYGVATSTLSASAPLTGSFTQVGMGGAIGCTTAASGVAGCLNSTDWATFNNKISSTSLSATAPLNYTPATGAFTITQAGTAANGYLSSTDWNTFNMKVATSAAETAGQVAIWGTTNGSPAKLYSLATTSESITGPFNIPATYGKLVGGSGSITYWGLSTTSNLTQGQLLYNTTGGNGVASVATTSVSCSGTIACTTFAALGASPITITSTFGYPFYTLTNYGTTTQATGTPVTLAGGFTSSSSATIASSTAWQLLLTDNSTFGGYALRAAHGNFYIASTSVSNATSTPLTSLTIAATTTGSLIGINTPTPRATLDIYEQNGVGASPSILLGGNAGGDTDFWISRITDNDGTSNDFLRIGTGTVPGLLPVFTINNSGNVGINVLTPNARLDVGGFINTDQFSGYNQGGNLLAYASTTNQDTIFGLKAGGNNATTSATVGNNSVFGYQAGSGITTGTGNTMIGEESGLGITTSGSNTGLGFNAVWKYNGGFNTAVGYNSMGSSGTGSTNTAIGYDSLTSVSSGSSNLAVGSLTLTSNTTGDHNSAIGNGALGSNTSGSTNVGIGNSSLSGVNTGWGNIGIGSNDISGAKNTITSGNNNLAIGNDVQFPSATANNQFNLGNILFGTLPATTTNTTFTLPTTGSIGIGTSSPGAKFAIQANNGDTATSLFQIGSSTASATTTLFNVLNTGNVGIGTTSPFGELSLNAPAGNTVPEFVIGSSTGTIFSVSSNNQTLVGIGTTSPWRGLSVATTAAFSGLVANSGGNALCLNPTTFEAENAGTQACTISSIRFKTNVEPFTGTEALSILKDIDSYSYDYKKGYYSPEDSPLGYGPIAEYVLKTHPELVDKKYDGTAGDLFWNKITGLNTAAINQLQIEIQNIKVGKAVRSAEENWQWGAIALLVFWNVYLTLRRKK